MRILLDTLLVAGALLVACGDGGSGATPSTVNAARVHPDEIRGAKSTAEFKDFEPADVARGDQVVLPLLNDIGNFNPYLATSATASELLGRLYLHPLEEQADYHDGPPTFSPLLVDRWSLEGKRLAMHIRDDAVWSDGKPITADDVRFSWSAAKSKDVAWVSASIVDHIVDVEVKGEKDYVLHYDRAYPDMLMDSKDWQILPRHVHGKVPFEEWKSYKDWPETCKVVSGPYKIDTYKQSEEYLLVPNERYWDKGLPRLSKVYFRVYKKQQTIFDSLLSGEVDFQSNIRYMDARKVLEHEDLYLYTYMSRGYSYVGWNCKHWIFKDPAVRRALTMAIDRWNIVETLYYGYAEVTASPIISSMWACDRSIEPYPFDPDAALELLESRGWKKGDDGWLSKDGKRFEFHLSAPSGSEVREQMAQMVQADLKRIGVKAHLSPQDYNTWGENLKQNKEDAWMGAWYVATKIDPKPTFHSSSFPGGFNFGAYANSRVDELIDKGRIEGDRESALAIWKEWQSIFHEDQPYTIVCESRSLHALRKRYHDVEMNALDVYFNLKEWFVPASLQAMTR